MFYSKSYKLKHPNPQFARENFEILDGIWNFAFDDNKDFVNDFPVDCLKIRVPFTYQSYNGLNIPTKDNDIIWYHKKIVITKLYASIDLVFLGCDYELILYVNKKYVGKHLGGYDQVRFNISEFLSLGENELTIKIVDYKKKDIIRGKQTTSSIEGCFYECVTGIYKSVYLEFHEKSYIDNYYLSTSYLNQKMRLEVNTINCVNKILKVEIFENKSLILSKKFEIASDKIVQEIEVNNIKPWSNNNPQLYDVILTICDEKIIYDKIFTYTGFQDYKVKNGRFYVNEEDTYLKGILYQGYYDKGFYTGQNEDYKKDLLLIKKMGFNFVRIHQKIEDPRWLYYADCLGLYCTLEIPSSKEFSSNYEKNYLKETSRIVLDNINHPCVFSLILFNESWGINNVKNDKLTQDFVLNCYNYYKKLYPNLLVCSNDGWEHVKSDICSIHNYAPEGEKLYLFEKKQYDLLLKNGDALANEANYHIYAQGYKYQNELIILSEFGGYGLNIDDSKNAWCYGKASNNVDDYILKLTNMYHYIKKLDFIRGICYTQFNDIYPELNGIVSIDRKEKIDIKILKKLNDLL